MAEPLDGCMTGHGVGSMRIASKDSICGAASARNAASRRYFEE